MSDFASDRAAVESTRQNAHKGAANEAAHIAADQAYYLSLVLLGRQYGIKTWAMAKLLQLGGTPPAGSFQSVDF